MIRRWPYDYVDVVYNVEVGGDLTVKGTLTASDVSYKTPLVSASVSPTVGTGGSAGAASTVLAPTSGHVGVVPLGGSVVFGGTFASGETVTVTITATFSDNTTASITKSATATGTVELTTADLFGIVKNGTYITKVEATAASSASSTSATVTVSMWGIQQ